MTIMASINPGMSSGWPIRFKVPRVLIKAKKTGNSEITVNFQSKKNKNKRMVTLIPMITNIFVNVEIKACRVFAKKRSDQIVCPQIDIFQKTFQPDKICR